MAKKIVVDCCRHCQFVDYLDELYPMDLQKCRPYCTYPELLQEYPNIEDVDEIPEWCKLEDN